MIEIEHQGLLRAIRSLQLPLPPESERDPIDLLILYGSDTTKKSLSPEDLTIILEQQNEDWRVSGIVGTELKEAIAICLGHVAPILELLDEDKYFDIYWRLRHNNKDFVGLSHQIARRLLSRASLIAHLLTEERFSCAQVARLLHATEPLLNVSYRAVEIVAKQLKIAPTLNASAAGNALWRQDSDLASTIFPDTDLSESIDITVAEIDIWMPEINVSTLLKRLSQSTTTNEPTWPYLQILHWCLTPTEFYDHPASYLYEFSPRGQIASSLFERYRTATGNPVLNNAKAVETLNSTWARNRGGEDAHALVELLESLEGLPFVSRRQVSRILRAWLIRVIEIQGVEPTLLEFEATRDIFECVTNRVCVADTNTHGVVEQRVVDALCVLAYQQRDWRPRGLRDGVNASNLSRRKMGDIEFVNVDKRSSIAIEAHGGHLSRVYVRDHTRSLARVIELRLNESWSALDDPGAWSVEVLFVAHSREDSEFPHRDQIHGVSVSYKYLDYYELLHSAYARSTETERLEVFQSLVIDVLNQSTVRESVRDKFREIVASCSSSTRCERSMI